MSDRSLRQGTPALHFIRLTAAHSRAALLALEDAIGTTGAEICRLNLNPIGDVVEARLSLKSIDEAGARKLGDRLACRVGIHSVQVEHAWAG